MEQKTNISEAQARAYFEEEFVKILGGKGDFALVLCQDEDARYGVYALIKTKKQLYSSISHTIEDNPENIDEYISYYREHVLNRESFYVAVHTDISREYATVVFYNHQNASCEPVKDIVAQEAENISLLGFTSHGKPGFCLTDKKTKLTSIFSRENNRTVCLGKNIDLRAICQNFPI